MDTEKERLTIEQIEKRRADKKSAYEADRNEQLLIDMEALEKAEDDHGIGRVVRVDMNGWKQGTPTMVLCRLPSTDELREYHESVHKNKGDARTALVAAENIARTLLLYPDRPTLVVMSQRCGDIVSTAGAKAVVVAQGKVAAEGKG
jgi:hypothetical protein